MVYCLPQSGRAFEQRIINKLIFSFDTIKTQHPNSYSIILGDFNDLDTSPLCNNLLLKQIVTVPTRGDNILDKVFTDLFDYYNIPIVINPISNSDHKTVIVRACASIPKETSRVVTFRPFRESSVRAFGDEITSTNWSHLLEHPGVNEMAADLQESLSELYHLHFLSSPYFARQMISPGSPSESCLSSKKGKLPLIPITWHVIRAFAIKLSVKSRYVKLLSIPTR